MAVFRGAYEETFTVDVPLDKAKAHFADLDNIGKNYDGVDTYEKVDEKTLRIHLIPQTAMGVTFKGEHVCKYVITESEISWTSDPGGNMRSRGRAAFKAQGDKRTSIAYRDELEIEMDINRFLAKPLQPIVRRSIEKGVKAYIERMRKGL